MAERNVSLLEDSVTGLKTSNGLKLSSVTGGTSTHNAIVKFNGTTGDVQNSSVVINDSGNVGIGTSNPSYKIDVNENTNSAALRLQTAGSGGCDLVVKATRSGSALIGVGSVNGSLSFGTGNSLGESATERMRIDSAGNVGIGTSSPATKLHVSRNSTDNILGLLENLYSNQGNLLQFNQNNGGTDRTAYIGHGGDATGDMVILNTATTNIKFYTSNVEKMRISSAGNLLVGSSTDNGVDKLQVNGSIKAKTLELTDILKVSGIYSQNSSATTLTLTFKGHKSYLGGIIDIYYTNINAANNQNASRKYMFNFSNPNSSNSRNLTEIGTGIGSQLTLTNLVTTQVSGDIYNYVFTFTFPAGGYPRFKFLSSFENFSSGDIYNFTATIS